MRFSTALGKTDLLIAPVSAKTEQMHSDFSPPMDKSIQTTSTSEVATVSQVKPVPPHTMSGKTHKAMTDNHFIVIHYRDAMPTILATNAALPPV
jgi:hypothetical protein